MYKYLKSTFSSLLRFIFKMMSGTKKKREIQIELQSRDKQELFPMSRHDDDDDFFSLLLFSIE